MQTKGIVDRFEGEHAVLLLGENSERLIVPKTSLPAETKEGDWLQLVIEAGVVKSAVIDSEETNKAKNRIAEKLAKLRRGEHR